MVVAITSPNSVTICPGPGEGAAGGVVGASGTSTTAPVALGLVLKSLAT